MAPGTPSSRRSSQSIDRESRLRPHRWGSARRWVVRQAWIVVLLAFAIAPYFEFSSIARSDPPAASFREPVALAISDDGSRLYAACSRSGSLVVIDSSTGKVLTEHSVGRSLADIAGISHSARFIAVDRLANTVIEIEVEHDAVRTIARVNVPDDPVTLVVSGDGTVAAVASLTGRRLSIVSPRPETLEMTKTIELSFPPRKLAWLADGKTLIVADAFGGSLAVIDAARGTIVSTFSIPAHNIRGLAVSPDGKSLAIAHQVLHPLARTTFEDVHWGSVISNHVRILRVKTLVEPGKNADPLRGSTLIDLGETGHAAGDPAAVAYDGEGRLIVALAGVDEVVIDADGSGAPQRMAVGRCPTALLLAQGGKVAWVANRFDDTVSQVPLRGGRLKTIALGPRPALSAIEHGERLFHDARLSHDGWMSCQSCHTDGHTNGLLIDTLGDGSFGAPKLVPSLLGVGTTAPWGWTGAFPRLEDQVRSSVETTMRGKPPMPCDVEDLTAFLKTLKPRRAGSDQTAAMARGRAVFEAKRCAECHAPSEYTTNDQFDVGLVDEVGNRKFNPPSLRGVGLRSAFLHDGRAATLEDVFSRVKHPRDTEMKADEVADLAAFLKSL